MENSDVLIMSENMILKDSYGRVVNYLRLSITDRCNFRCFYCKPIKEFKYIPHSDVLSFEDLFFLISVLKKYGVNKLRITGGEPFVRHDFISFLSSASSIIPSVYITTNGYFLKKEIQYLINLGVKGINISLDTLSKEKFLSITKVDALSQVKEGIEIASKSNLKIKINTVLMKKNLDEIIDLIAYANKLKLPIRFIELMPISSEVRKEFVSEETAKRKIKEKYELIKEKNVFGIGPSIYYKVERKGEQGIIGFISAMTHNFCSTCNKIRITSDGKLRVCLASDDEVSLKEAIKNRDEAELINLVKKALSNKPEKHNMSIYKKHIIKSMFQIGG